MAWSWSQSNSSSSGGVSARVDILKLCEGNVRTIGDLSRVADLLNKRQCQDLSTKLSKTIQNVQELVSLCGASTSDLFRPALKSFYLCLEKAKELVSNCGDEDWCAQSVFQSRNENAFREILLEVGLCYNAIYEQAKNCRKEKWKGHPDLRKSSMFVPAKVSEIREDQHETRKRLEELVNLVLLDQFEEGRNSIEQCRARYLLRKLDCTSENSPTNTFNRCNEILWETESEPQDTWGNGKLLGSGAGSSGVIRTKWLGIPCAKKEFHEHGTEPVFLKEASILAGLNHPRIVNFICCGNGQERGDRFIAMELMEKSLFNQIEDQKRKNEQFSIPVVVDMMVQMARGMLYLHDRGVAHRDLKPQNVVVKTLTFPQVCLVNYFCVKLVDFGISKTEVVDLKSITPSGRGIGTTKYRAPEVHPKTNPGRKQKAIWFKADVYSFAITCAHVFSLKTPYEDIESGDLHVQLLNGTRPELPNNCPQELVSLLKDCWNTTPRSRPTFKEICTRLETFRYKLLRGFSTIDQGFEKEEMDFRTEFDFIKKKMEDQSSINKGELVDSEAKVQVCEISKTEEVYKFSKTEEVCEFNEDGVVSIITCTNDHALVPLKESAYSNEFNCNMCRNPGRGMVYHCKTCEFDAHPYCAEIKKEIEKVNSVFFHDYPLLIRKYDNNNLHSTCGFCQRPLQNGDWVYKSEQGNFHVHALCTKYSKEMVHLEHPGSMQHYEIPEHLLTLVESEPHKICNCCRSDLKGYHYSCTQCSFHLHPFCATVPTRPPCILNTSHQLSLVTNPNKGFDRCGKCKNSGLSWYYHCSTCIVDIHLNCLTSVTAIKEYT